MPYASSYPPIAIPEHEDLWSIVFERDNKTRFPGTKEIATAAETGRTYTHDDIRDRAVEFGKGMRTRWGWAKGDVLAVYSPNTIDTLVTMMGAIWAGATVAPANPLYTVEELTHQLRDSGAVAIVTHVTCLSKALVAAERVGIPTERVVLQGDRDNDDGHEHDVDAHFSWLRGDDIPLGRVRASKKDVAFLVYSSGTTGLPKGVCLTHHNMVATLHQLGAGDGHEFRPDGGLDGKGDKLMGVLPSFHIYGLECGVLGPLYFGWHVFVMQRFSLKLMLDTTQRYGVTVMYLPPPLVLALAKDPLVGEYDLCSVRMVHSGAAPLSEDLVLAVWHRLKLPVKQGYGMSENALTHSQRTSEWARYMGSVGKLVPNMEAKIVDENGRDVGDGQEGELWVKGPNVFVGYLNNAEATRAAFSPCGYFKTGDVFRRDRHGNYYCVDRLKELIKYKAFAVAPAELEGLLVGHPDVADACVIGVNRHATELPRAYVVLEPGPQRQECPAKARELEAWVAARVAPHKKLRGGLRFVSSIPKSPTGKVLRRHVREWAKKEEGQAAKL